MQKMTAGVLLLAFVLALSACASHQPRDNDYRRRTIDAREDARRQR